MRSPALAVGWEFRRHAWPLIAMGAYMLVLAAIKLLGYAPAEPVRIAPPDGRAAVLIAPLSWAFFYYLAVFSFGLSNDMAARQSIFPARLFTLPVRTESLVRGPMLHGTAAVATLVLAATLLAHWPWHIAGPVLWPAVLAAVFLAWTQALTWMPYGLPYMRVILTVLWLAALDAVVIVAMHYQISEPVMLAILVPQLPLAYLTACRAVARARRGDVPDWSPSFARRVAAERRAHPPVGFTSAARAQAWLEWRREGWPLPAMTAAVLPFELALLWLARDAPGFVIEIVLLALITPPLLAMFAATTAREAAGISPFIATRPLTSPALIAAKLTMAMRSTLAAWLLVLLAVPVALAASGTWPAVLDESRRVHAVFGTPRAIVLALLGLSLLMASTWKQLVQGLYISLTGRAWVVRSALALVLAFVVFMGPALDWLADNKRAQALLWVSLPWILAALVLLKMLAAAWVAARLTRSGLLSDRTLVNGAALWTAAVFALYGVLAWLLSGPLVPGYIMLLIAILVVPLARLSAAPLALAWNRHR